MKWKEQMQEKINNHMKIIDICGLGIILGGLIIGPLIGIRYLGMGRIKEFVITFIVNVMVLSAVMTAFICHKSVEEKKMKTSEAKTIAEYRQLQVEMIQNWIDSNFVEDSVTWEMDGANAIKVMDRTGDSMVVQLSEIDNSYQQELSGEEELSNEDITNEDIVNIVGFIFLMIFIVLPLTVMTISTIKDLVNQ